MVGAVVENVSNAKLCGILFCLLVAQIVFFLLGGLISPAPSSHMTFLMTKCIDINYSPKGRDEWFFLRPPGHCRRLDSTLDYHVEIVYVAQMPHQRDGRQLEYSPWFQSILGLVSVETEYGHGPNVWAMDAAPLLTLEVRLGYRDQADESTQFHELATSTISRSLTCHLDPEEASSGGVYQCEALDLFEMGSADHPFYLLNIRLPGCNETQGRANCHIGRIEDLSVVAIHQNGGFTQVWLSLKTALFPVVAYFLHWYWRRLGALPRPPVLLEKSIGVLGLVMAGLDLPLEWLSLSFSMPWLLLLSDLRQGLFYLCLGGFWMIYAGEHLTGDVAKHQLSFYWQRLGSLVVGCACLLVYDICERGVRLRNPFYSLWATDLGTRLAYGFIVLAAICAVVYFIYMSVLLVRVWLNIKRKRADLRAASEGRQIRFAGLIFRLKFLTALTAVCLALTVAAAMMERIGEGQLHWGDHESAPLLNYSSAFLTGVFGMWNLYVLLLLWMYAPSHKRYHRPIDEDDKSDEVLIDSGMSLTENRLPLTEESALTTFVKPATD